MNQTFDEQAKASTDHDNGIGFTGADAAFLTSIAQWIIRSTRPEGKRLTYGQIIKVRPLMGKYWRQLRDVIIQKETKEKNQYAFTS